MKNWKKSIKWLYLLILIILAFAYYKGALDLKLITENQFNIITVNTVFSGFLFTSLGIIAGFSNNTSIRKFERISTMDKIYKCILKGLIFSVLSSIVALIIALFDFNFIIGNRYIYNILKSIGYISELFFLAMTIIYFSFSVKNTFFAISVVRADIKSKIPNKEETQKILNKIK